MVAKLYDVGTIFHDTKKLVEEFPRRHGKRMFKWQCLRCFNIYGPSQIQDIKRYATGQCCVDSEDYGRVRHGYKDITPAYMRSLHWSAKKRNLEFAVSAQYLWQLWLDQDSKCAYTGRQLQLSGNASLDRRDNKQGYIEGNVQWVHANVNTLKWDMNEAEFYSICEEILNYRRLKNE